MATPKEYQKLPGSGTRFEGSRLIAGIRKTCTLWLGTDHLLQLLATGYQQESKRFYYRDIQAITVRRTGAEKATNLALFGFAALFALGAFFSPPILDGVLGVIACLFGLFGIINVVLYVWRGPRCVTELKTAVQKEELSSLQRVRTAEKVLALLRPHIEAAQGTLSADEIQLQVSSIPPVYGAPGTAVQHANSAAKPLKFCSGRVHQILFALLILDGFLTALQIFVHPPAVLAVGTIVSLGVAAMMIAALIQQYQSDIPPALRLLTWGTCIYAAIAIIHGMSVDVATSGGRQNPLQGAAEIDPLTTPWLLVPLVLSAIVSLVLGLMGSIMTSRFRDQKLPPPVPPTLPPLTDPPV